MSIARRRGWAVRPSVLTLEDRSVPAVTAAYAVTNDWGSGFQAEVRLANTGPAAVPFTSLSFALPAVVSSLWDAKVTSKSGNQYTVTNAGWNAAVPAGGSVSFGFVASPGRAAAATGFVFNGVALGATSPPPVSPPPASPPPASPPPASPPPATTGSAVAFKSAGDWGSGMTGEITVKNTGATAVTNWSLAFTLPGTIDAMWNAKVVGRAGTRYVVAPEDWAKTIPAGGSVTIGFNSSPGGIAATDFAFTPAGGTSPPPVSPPPPAAANRAPVAAADSTAAVAGQLVTVSVLMNDSDPDGDPLRVTGVGRPMNGTAVVNADNTVSYTPNAGFTGTDSFTYVVSDGRGGTATGTVTVGVSAPAPPAAPSAWPSRVFAPYVDSTLYPLYDFVSAARTTGSKYFTLAFVTADPSNRPAWGGYAEYAVTGTEFDVNMRARINQLRALGGDVAVSFGGAAGRELGEMITDVNALAAAYRSVIQAYNLTHIDFDIEGAAAAHKSSIDRRWEAVAILQREAAAAGRELNVRLTLPVLPTGLTPDGVYVVTSAKARGVRVDNVNVMAMDYGGSAAPNPQGRMGDYAIQAGTSLFNQLTAIYGTTTTEAQRWKMVGLTPMIGMNDVQTEVFDQQEAREVAAWARSKDIGYLGFWSLNRDRQNAAGAINYVDLFSSSVVQTPFEFTGIFAPFSG
jgi:chitinase